MHAENCSSGTLEAWIDAGCLQGVRIDYALCSSGLLEHVVSCEILSLPPKWSDHAALVLGELQAGPKVVQTLYNNVCMLCYIGAAWLPQPKRKSTELLDHMFLRFVSTASMSR